MSIHAPAGFRSLSLIIIAMAGMFAAEPVVQVVATDATAAESGDAGAYTISRTGDVATALAVLVGFSGTAAMGADYAAPPVVVIIPAGAASALLAIAPIQDSTPEATETVILTLGAGPGYVVGASATATVTVADDEAPVVTVIASDATGAETMSGQTANPAKFTLTRLGSRASAVTVGYVVGGSATMGSDYQNLSGTATIAANGASVVVSVTPIDDQAWDGDETVTMTVSPGSGYSIGVPAQGQVTIQDDEPSVTIAASDAVLGEGTTVGGSGLLTLTRRGRTDQALAVRLAYGGTAIMGSDYTASLDPVFIPAGVATATVMVVTSDDALCEGQETVVVTVLSGTGYTVGAGNSAQCTINDDENVVSLTASDAIAAEPGTDKATIALTRSGNIDSALTVTYAVSGTATSGSDFKPLTGVATILAGKTSVGISITAKNDGLIESAETVVLTLVSGAGYGIGPVATATAYIRDDETATPSLTIMALQPWTSEGGAGGILRVSRSGNSDSALTVGLKIGGTAKNGVDYLALPGTVTIPAGVMSLDVPVTPANDTAAELAETVMVTLQAGSNYVLGIATSATVTIADDEPTSLTIATTDASALEPGSDGGLFTLNRRGNTVGAVEVRYVVGGSASNGSDYAVLSGAVMLADGVVTMPIPVIILDDAASEPLETLDLILSAGVGYVLGSQKTGAVAISDDDAAGVVLSVPANAGESGAVGRFRLTRTGPLGTPISVSYSLNGTAVQGVDYHALSGSVSLAADVASTDIDIVPIDDGAVEGAETVGISITANVGIEGTTSATLSITDDDPNVAFVATASAVAESAASAVVEVRLSAPSTSIVTVKWAVAGTAAVGTDHALAAGKLTFPVGVTSRSIVVPLIPDQFDETDETVVLTLSKPVGVLLGSATVHTLTIQDDEATPMVQFAAPTSVIHEADGSATIPVTLSGASSRPVSLMYAITGGTATSGADVVLPTGALTFAPGTITASISVAVNADGQVEGDETVVISLSSPTNAIAGSPMAHGLTIIDSDQPPTPQVQFAAAGTVVDESDGNVSILVTLGRPAEQDVAITFAISGTADDEDRLVMPSPLVIRKGGFQGAIVVGITNDNGAEAVETLDLAITGASGAPLGARTTHRITINDDDQAYLPSVGFVQDATSAPESAGFAPGLTLRLSQVTDHPVTVGWRWISGSGAGLAQAPADLPASGQVIIPVGAIEAPMTLAIVDDTLFEGDELARIEIADVDGAVLGAKRILAHTIVEDEASATVSFATATSTFDEDAATVQIGLAMIPPVLRPVSVSVIVQSTSTASTSTDCQVVSGVATFAPGAATAQVSVRILEDAGIEPNETLVLKIGTVSPGTSVGTQNLHTLTIRDDDIGLPNLTPATGLYPDGVTLGMNGVPGHAQVYFTATDPSQAPVDPVPGHAGTLLWDSLGSLHLTASTRIRAVSALPSGSGFSTSPVVEAVYRIVSSTSGSDGQPAAGGVQVSPYCWSLTSPQPDLQVNVKRTLAGADSAVTALRIGEVAWVANVPLDANGPVTATATFTTPNGPLNPRSRQVSWAKTDLAGRTSDNDQLTIRVNDSLLFTATGLGSLLGIDGGNGITPAGAPGQGLAVQYTAPGDYIATARLDGALVGSMRILVVAAPFTANERILAEVGNERHYTVPITPAPAAGSVMFTSEDALLMTIMSSGTCGNEATAGIKVLQRGTPRLVARVNGSSGPVLAVQVITEFQVIHEAGDGVLTAKAESGSPDRCFATLAITPAIPELKLRLSGAQFFHPNSYPYPYPGSEETELVATVAMDMVPDGSGELHPGDGPATRYAFMPTRSSSSYKAEVFEVKPAPGDAEQTVDVPLGLQRSIAISHLMADLITTSPDDTQERTVNVAGSSFSNWSFNPAPPITCTIPVTPGNAVVDGRLGWERFGYYYGYYGGTYESLAAVAKAGTHYVVEQDLLQINREIGDSESANFYVSSTYKWPGWSGSYPYYESGVELDSASISVHSPYPYLQLQNLVVNGTVAVSMSQSGNHSYPEHRSEPIELTLPADGTIAVNVSAQAFELVGDGQENPSNGVSATHLYGIGLTDPYDYYDYHNYTAHPLNDGTYTATLGHPGRYPLLVGPVVPDSQYGYPYAGYWYGYGYGYNYGGYYFAVEHAGEIKVLGQELHLSGGSSRSGVSSVFPSSYNNYQYWESSSRALGRNPVTNNLRYRQVQVVGFGAYHALNSRIPVSFQVTAQGSAYTGSSTVLQRSHDRVKFFTEATGGDPVFADQELSRTFNPADWFPSGDEGWREGYDQMVTIYAEYTVDEEIDLTLSMGSQKVELNLVRLSNGIGAPDGLSPSLAIAGGAGAIDLSRGNLFFSAPVETFPTPIPGPDLSVSYNSLDGLATELGRGWRHTYDMRFYIGAGVACVVDGDGTRLAVPDPASGYAPGVASRWLGASSEARTGDLSQASGEWQANEEFRVIPHDGRIYYFDHEGRLLRIHDIRGHDLTVTRDAQGKALRVSDSLSGSARRVVSLARQDVTGDSGSGVTPLATLDHLLSGVWSFTYPSGRMQTATLHGSADTGHFSHGSDTMTWRFDANSSGQVTLVTDPAVNAPQADGSSQSQVFSQTIDYGGDLHADEVTVSDSTGGVTKYTINPSADAWTVITDPMNVIITREIDTYRRLLTRTYVGPLATRRGEMTFQYDSKGNQTYSKSFNAPSPDTVITTAWSDQGILGANLKIEQKVLGVTGIEGSAGARDLITTYAYETADAKAGLIKSITAPLHQGGMATQTYIYNDLGFLTAAVDALARTTAYQEHTVYGLPTVEVIPIGRTAADNATRSLHTTWIDEGRSGLADTVEDRLGYVTKRHYDRLRRVVRVDHPGGEYEETTYDPLGNPLRARDVRGSISTATYDAQGRMVEQVEPGISLPIKTFYANQIDALMKTWVVISQRGSERYSCVRFDPAGRLIHSVVRRERVEGAVGPQDCYYRNEYDPVTGWLSARSDGRDNLTTYEYDNGGRVIAARLPRRTGMGAKASYNAVGWMLTGTDADGVAAGGSTTMTYDVAGNVRKQTNARGGYVERMYDTMGQLTSVIPSLGQGETYAYDKSGVMIAHTDKYGQKTETFIDSTQRSVTTRSGGDPRRTTKATLDDRGDLAHVQGPTGSMNIAREAGGLPTRIARSGRLPLRINHHPDGRPSTRYHEGAGGVPLLASGRVYDDQTGKAQQIISSSGLVTAPQFDGQGDVQGSADNVDAAPGQPLQTQANGMVLSVDRDGHPLRVADGMNRVTVQEWDENGRLTARILPVSNDSPIAVRIEYVYTDAGRTARQTRKSGDAVLESRTSTYNNLGLLEHVEHSSLGPVYHAEYSSVGDLLSVVTPDERRAYAYYPLTRDLWRETLNETQETEYRYDERGNLAKTIQRVIEQEGEPATERTISEVRHDFLDRPEEFVDPDGGIQRIERDADGDTRLVTDRDGTTTSMDHDELGRLAWATVVAPPSAPGEPSRTTTMSFAYEYPSDATVSVPGSPVSIPVPSGTVTRITQDGQTLTMTSDRRSRRTRLEMPGQAAVDMRYNRGNQLTQRGSVGMGYDGAGLLRTVTHPAVPGTLCQLEYDPAGRVISERLPGLVREYGYDEASRLVSLIQRVENGTERNQSVVRDLQGRILSVTDAEGATGYGYDQRGRLAWERCVGVRPTLVVYRHDGNGNRLGSTAGAVVPSGMDRTWTALAGGGLPAELTAATGLWAADAGPVTASAMAGATARATLALPVGAGPYLSLATEVPITGLATGQSREAGIAYGDGNGNDTQVLLQALPGGLVRVILRDVPAAGIPRQLGQSQGITMAAGLRLVVVKQPLRGVVAQLETSGKRVLARLTGLAARELDGPVALVASGTGVAPDATFSGLRFDVVGGRRDESYVYGPGDRLDQKVIVEGDSTTTVAYAYDAARSLSSTVTTVNQQGVVQPATTVRYDYDALRRVAKITGLPLGDLTYAYQPGSWQRSTSTRNGVTTRYAWDGRHLTGETTDGTTRNYVYGSGSTPLGQVDDATALSAKWSSLGRTIQGDVTERVAQVNDAAQAGGFAVVRTFTYDAFGNTAEHFRQVEEGGGVTYPAIAEATTGPRYRGQWLQEDGDYFLRNRIYDPASGRFTQSDPARAGMNWYAYCDGDPVNRSDPSGLDYVKTDGNNAYWVVENMGWMYHADVRTVYIGDVSNGQINLIGEMGGGEIGLNEAKEVAGRFWLNNNDMSGWPMKTQNAAIRLSLNRGKNGDLGASVADAQDMYVFAAVEGLGQGGRNLAEPVAILADGVTNTAAVATGYDLGTSLSYASDAGGLMDQIDTVMELSREEGRGVIGQYWNGVGHVAANGTGTNNLTEAFTGEGVAWDESGRIAGIDELSTGERWMRGTMGTLQAAGTVASVFGAARITAPKIELKVRNWQVKSAARKMGYDPGKVQYVHEIGLKDGFQFGRIDMHTGEILIDRFAFMRRTLARATGTKGMTWRAVLAHEVGHTKPIHQPTMHPIGPMDPVEFWASIWGADQRGLSDAEIRALIEHAYNVSR